MNTRSRRCVVLRGTHEETRESAIACTRALDPSEVLWTSPDAPRGARVISQRALDTLLGQSLDAVVLDLHGPLDPDTIARAEGLIRGGGALVLRLPPASAEIARRSDFAIHPYTLEDVGTRFARRFEERLPAAGPASIATVSHETEATREQDAVVDCLASAFVAREPIVVTLLADRGRGKSAALGRAIRRARETTPALRVVVTAANREALIEVLRFAGEVVSFVDPEELARSAPDVDVVVIDEAAQLPVALAKRIVSAHPRARVVLATTTRGYEGTGQGFSLRFLSWARARAVPTLELTLREPIRWAENDTLERWVRDVLMLDAEPAALASESRSVAHHRVLDRDRLAADERTLRQLFGLLVHAHYRTTPNDLSRLLDAPNLDVHALFEGDDVVAASLVAREGSLPRALVDAMALGSKRVAGHALADTLVSHALRTDAASLSMIRSVRIAVHESRRRRGLARALVEAIHAHYTPDLFGTIFGATAELVSFRQALGYEVVRVGVSRGARSGEPAVVMIRPRSDAARALVASLRDDLSRELEQQLSLMETDESAPIDPELRSALVRSLPTSREAELGERRAIALRYASSTQPVDVVAASLGRFVRDHEVLLATLDVRSRALLQARLVDRVSWSEVAARAAMPSVAAAMRSMRGAVRALLFAIDG